MKKVLSILAATAVLTVATGAMASIINTAHDLSSAGPAPYRTNTNQVCVFCHTPHNSTMTRALWNRNNPTTGFSLYTSGANVESTTWYVGTQKNTLPTDSPSLLCLSCHDGSTSLVSAIAAKPGDVATLQIQDATVRGAGSLIGGGAALGTNLTNDHPISLIYENVRATAGMAGTLVASDANGLVNGLPLSKKQNLECNTCHNVHDNTVVPFLRMSNDQSALCRACHIK